MSRWVADGEQDAGPERVLRPPPPVDEAQPRIGEDLLGKVECLGQPVPVVRRPPEPEAADDVTVVAPRAEVIAGRAGVGRLQEPLVVPGHRPFHRVEERGAPLVVAARLVVLMERDASSVGQEPHRVDEVEMLHAADKGDGIARRMAPEAVVEALLRVDAERRCLLGVERTQARPPPADLLKRRVLANERHDVGGRPDRGDFLVGDPHDPNVPRRCASRDGPRFCWWSPSTGSARSLSE